MIMSSGHERHDLEAWKYADKAMTWYGCGSPVGIGLLIVSIGVFLVLIHHEGLV
jgi:hypothetical protein